MLEFAVFPHLSCHPLPAAAGIIGKKRTRDCIREQVREGIRNPDRYRKVLVDEIGVVSAQFFHRIGDCRLLL